MSETTPLGPNKRVYTVANDSADSSESGSSSLQPPLTRSRTMEEMARFEQTEETPLGRHIGVFGAMMLIIQAVIGSGIFAVPGSIYKDVGGSPFLFFLVWAMAGYMSFAGVSCFLELGSIVPRGGGMKTFLEYIYYKPRKMMAVTFSLYSLMFGFVITNAIIFGEYAMSACGYDDVVGSKASKHVGLVFVVLVCVVNGVSVQLGVGLQNTVGVMKLGLLFLMALSGVWVLIAPESMSGVSNNLHLSDFFAAKHPVSVSSFASALLKGVFSFGGWQTVHVVANEIQDPVRTINKAAPLALSIINVCYFFINLSYLVVIPDKDLNKLEEMVGSALMERIFGYVVGRRVLTTTVAISAAGNIMAVLFHMSRMNQEVFREGFLPFSRFFVSNYPFGSPSRCLLFPLVLTSFFLIIPTPDNVYSYVVTLEGYPLQLFIGLTCFGVVIVRRRRPDIKPAFRAPIINVVFTTCFSLFMFFGPLNPFSRTDEFPGLPHYAYVAICILLCCLLYWFGMFVALPWIGGYTLESQTDTLSDGLTMKRWVKVKGGEVYSGV